MINLCKTKGVPYYRQIANYIEDCIAKGIYPVGMKLHTERELASILNVNRSTIHAAYEELRAKGLVERNVSIGTIVAPNDKKAIHYITPPPAISNIQQQQSILQQIQTKKQSQQIINFASADLSADLQPRSLCAPFDPFLQPAFDAGHPQGQEELRHVIAHHMKKYRQIESTANNILVTAGARQAIYLAASSLLQKGDAIAIGNPSFAYTLPIFHENRFKTHFLDIDKEGVNPDQVLSLYKKHRIKMIFINPTYQNPTGARVTLERKKRLYEICPLYGITVVEDDPSNLNSHMYQHEYTLKSMDDCGIVIYVSSLSKVIGSGAKIGWITASQPIIDHLTMMKLQMDAGLPHLSQRVATEVLKAEQFSQHISNLRLMLNEKKKATTDILKKYFQDELTFYEPEGGTNLWCKPSEPSFQINELFKQAAKQNVIFTPGSIFGSNPRYFRISYSALDKPDIEKGIELLHDAYQSTLKRQNIQ